MLARACGKTSVHSLEPEDLAALTMEASARVMLVKRCLALRVCSITRRSWSASRLIESRLLSASSTEEAPNRIASGSESPCS